MPMVFFALVTVESAFKIRVNPVYPCTKIEQMDTFFGFDRFSLSQVRVERRYTFVGQICFSLITRLLFVNLPCGKIYIVAK